MAPTLGYVSKNFCGRREESLVKKTDQIVLETGGINLRVDGSN